MHIVTVSIGSNIGTVHMGTLSWDAFKLSTRRIVRDTFGFVGEGGVARYEEHTGTGYWGGYEEESFKYTAMFDLAPNERLLAELRKALSLLGFHYQQDAIALTIGESELIGASVIA